MQIGQVSLNWKKKSPKWNWLVKSRLSWVGRNLFWNGKFPNYRCVVHSLHRYYVLLALSHFTICYLSLCIKKKKQDAEKWIRDFPTLKMFPSSGRDNQILKNYNMFYSSYKETYNGVEVNYNSQEAAANSCYISSIHSSFSGINTFHWLDSSVIPSSHSSHILPSPPQRWACNEGKAQHNVPSSWSQWLVQG